jgi:hypothetical protein
MTRAYGQDEWATTRAVELPGWVAHKAQLVVCDRVPRKDVLLVLQMLGLDQRVSSPATADR